MVHDQTENPINFASHLIDVKGGTSTACKDKDAVTVAGRDAYGSGWHIHLRD